MFFKSGFEKPQISQLKECLTAWSFKRFSHLNCILMLCDICYKRSFFHIFFRRSNMIFSALKNKQKPRAAIITQTFATISKRPE